MPTAKKTKKPDLKKTIRIACTGADVIDIDKLTDFQGALKDLSDEAYKKLRASILELGFSFPVDVWKNKNKNFILDAHQRVKTLKRMRDEEGYKIPPLPVNWIEASNEKEAAMKLLAATSQYGVISIDGLNSFMQTFSLDIKDFENTFTFPEVDFDSFKLTFFPETTRVSFDAKKHWDGMPEFNVEDKTAFRSLIVHFYDQAGVDKFAKIVRQQITEKTRMLWYPEIIIETRKDKVYETTA